MFIDNHGYCFLVTMDNNWRLLINADFRGNA